MRRKCKYRNYTCRSCGKVGHLQNVCTNVKFMEPEKQLEEQSEESFSLFTLNLEDKFCSNHLYSCNSIYNNVSNSFRSQLGLFYYACGGGKREIEI